MEFHHPAANPARIPGMTALLPTPFARLGGLRKGISFWCAIVALPLLAPARLAAGPIPRIALSDQFDQFHEHRPPFQRPMVVVLADRRGSSHIESWVTELYRSKGDSIEIVGIADLHGVPDFVKRPLRKAFRAQCADYPILLDWSGAAADGFPRGESGIDIYSVNASGEITGSVSGEMTRAKFEALTRAL